MAESDVFANTGDIFLSIDGVDQLRLLYLYEAGAMFILVVDVVLTAVFFARSSCHLEIHDTIVTDAITGVSEGERAVISASEP